MMEWDELLRCLGQVTKSTQPDTVRWMLETSGNYTTRSLYKHLLNPGVAHTAMTEIWQAKIPLKVKIFIWLLNKDRIQAAEQLKKKKWKGPANCKMCNQIETPSHIMFDCAVANYLWCQICDVLGWRSKPKSISDVNTMAFWNDRRKEQKLVALIIAAACWAIWLARNNYVFRNEILHNPDSLMHKMAILMQK